MALHFINTNQNVVEIGAVTPYYTHVTHPIIDLVDPLANITMDALDYNLNGKSVLCISSLEHFGFGDFSGVDREAIPRFLKKLTSNYLVTVPLGYNTYCDSLIRNLPVTYYTRTDLNNNWAKVTDVSNLVTTYGKPFPWANTVAVISDIECYHDIRWEDEDL